MAIRLVPASYTVVLNLEMMKFHVHVFSKLDLFNEGFLFESPAFTGLVDCGIHWAS